MGHLTLIAEEVVKFVQLYPSNTLSDLIDIKVESDVWEEYVNNVLYDTREKYNAILGVVMKMMKTMKKMMKTPLLKKVLGK